MELTNKQLKQFIDIYNKRFGVLLNKDQALEASNLLLNLIKKLILN